MPLVACPFCREMFDQIEARACPICGVPLKRFEELPPSLEALDQDGVPLAPETELLPAAYLGRGRGALVALATLGLGLFFSPWVHITLPDNLVLSGFDVARRLGWAWGAAVAWFVLIPTVWSRRTIVQMRGARVAVAFLSGVPSVTALVLLARPPRGGLVPLRFTYDWALHATLAVSLCAFLISLRFGGRADDIRLAKGTSHGQTLH